MRFDIENLDDLVNAIAEINKAKPELSHIFVLKDTAENTYRFVIGRHGLVKIDSDRRGEAIHPQENLQ